MPRSTDPGVVGPPVVPWARKRIARGFWLFLVLTLAGFVLVSRGTLGSSLQGLRHLAPWAVLVGFAQVVLDQFLGGLRIRVCIEALGGRASLWSCVQANASNVFMGGVTPSQSAGGPAQIYCLMRAGSSFAMASVTSFCTFLGTTLVFLGLATWITLRPPPFDLPGFRLFTSATITVFGLMVALSLLALPRPSFYQGGFRRKLTRWGGIGRRLGTSRTLVRLERLFEEYARLMQAAVQKGKTRFATALVLSALLYANKFLIAWVVLHGLGLQAEVGQVLYLQAVQYLVLYFAPTPGASGLAEFAGTHIMSSLVSGQHLFAYLLLWRTFSLYAGMSIGALVLLRLALTLTHDREPRGDTGPGSG